MSDVISLDWIGVQLRTIQAEERTIRDENRLLRSALNEAITLLMQRIGNFEALVDTRLDQHRVHVDQRITGLAIQLDRIEALLRPGDR